MKLVIAEKPQLGQVIAQAIGIKNRHDGFFECENNFTVTWCIGHVLELAKPEIYNPNYKNWVFDDLPLKTRPFKMSVKSSTKKQFLVVEDLLKTAKTVVNAGDFDDEGQLLIREVLDFCNFQGEIQRLIINDLNIDSVKKSLNNLVPDSKFDGMYKKALARSQADFMFGINLSRAYNISAQKKGINELFSVGRVQTPTLGLIVNRYLSNKNHESSFFYTVFGIFNIENVSLKTKLVINESIAVNDNNRIIDASLPEAIKNSCLNKEAKIKNYEVKQNKKPAPLPFSLLDLQAKMNDAYGFSADKTLNITQELREKYKAITYNRSDCRYLTSEQLADAPKTIDFLKKVLNEVDYEIINPQFPSRAFNNEKVTAHTGIIPVSANFSISSLNEDELKVYQAIAYQYLIQFAPEKEYDTCTLTISCSEYDFTTSATNTTNNGWANLVPEQEEKEEEIIDNFQVLASLSEAKNSICTDIIISKEKTKPLPIYTESTLLKDLQRVAKYVDDPKIKTLLLEKDRGREGENGGIGTPATRSAIIKSLNDKGYFNYDGKKLIPTQKGIDLIKAVPASISKPDITALWFEQQLEIERGNLSIDAFLDDLENFIKAEIASASDLKMELKGEACPVCENGVMALKKGKEQNFLACTNYPVCKHTQSLLNNEPIPACPCCSRPLKNSLKTINCECGLTVWKTVAEKPLTDSQLISLLKKGKTNKIKGFKSKAGKEFDAILALDKEQKKVSFIFEKKI